MDQYIVSARKYRPSTFESVVGQQSLTATLKNAIASQRLAHAYLFCGGRGVGKTSCARIFAKTINCSSRTPQGEACGHCDSCRQFDQGRSLNIIELDAASHNGVEDIKDLIAQVMVPPVTGRYRVFIIDEVHMLSQAAFNAFLKTLEEPPAHAIFILATTEKHKILPTILSRCQIFDFNRISVADMCAHLGNVASREGITTEPAALAMIARKADGAMRDALSIFDQVAACTRGNITYEATIANLNVLDSTYYNRLLDAFLAQDVPAALLIYKEVRDKGFDSQFFINGLGLYLRDLMAAANPATISLVELPDDMRAQMAERGAKLHPTFIYKAMELCNSADFNFRAASNKQFLIELTLIRLCQLLSPSPEDKGDDEGRILPLKAASPAATTNSTTSVPTAAPSNDTYPAIASPTPTAMPATKPPAPTQPTAKQPAATYSSGAFSISAGLAARPAPKPEPQKPADTVAGDTVQHARRDFTDAELATAWRRFAASPGIEALPASVMGEFMPVRNPGGDFRMVVGAPLQADTIAAIKPRIVQALRKELQNDDFDFEITVDDSDLPPTYWSEQRVLEHMVEHNPGLAKLIQKYRMRLC